MYKVSTASAVVTVPLVGGAEATINRADISKIVGHRWYCVNGRAVAFRKARDGSRVGVYMHRLIAGVADGRFVYHRNGNLLDNRRANLVSR